MLAGSCFISACLVYSSVSLLASYRAMFWQAVLASRKETGSVTLGAAVVVAGASEAADEEGAGCGCFISTHIRTPATAPTATTSRDARTTTMAIRRLRP